MTSLNPRLRRAACALALLLALYALLGFAGLPALLRWGAERAGSDALGRALTLEQVRFNPFTLRLTLAGLRVAGAADETEPLLALRGATVDLAWQSLWRLAPVADALQLDAPELHLARTGPGQSNVDDVLARLAARPSDPDAGPARFALHNIEIADGRLSLDDRVRGRHDEIDAIALGLPFVSSLPAHAEIRVQPHLAARVNGAALALEGELLPFGPSLDTVLRLKLDGLDLPNLLSLAPLAPAFALPHGLLDTDLTLSYRRAVAASADAPAVAAALTLRGSAALRELELTGADGRLLTLRRLALVLDEARLLDRDIAIAELSLDAPALELMRDAGGSNWQRLLAQPLRAEAGTATGGPAPALAPAPAPAPAAAPSAPWHFSLARLRIADGSLRLVDATVGGVERRLQAIALDLAGLGNAPGQTGRLVASAGTPAGERLRLDGSVGLAPPAAQLRIALQDLRLDDLAPWLAGRLDGQLGGRLDAAATLDAGSAATPRLSDIAIALRGLRLRGPAEAGAELDLARLALDGGTVDVAARRIDLGRLRLDAPRVELRRLADGSLGWARLLRAAPTDAAPTPALAATSSAAGAATSAPAAEPQAAPWTVTLAETRIERGEVGIEDFTRRPALRQRLTGIAVGAGRLAPGSADQVPLDFKARLGAGRIAADGWIALAPVAARLRLDLGRIDLAPAQPWLADSFDAQLASALLSTRGQLDLALAPGAAPRVGYAGNLLIEDFRLADAAGTTDLVSWQALTLDRLALRGAAPLALDVGQIAIGGFHARVRISPEGRLNLADLRKKPPGQPAEKGGAASAPASAAPAAPAVALGIDGIALGNGSVDFTDDFVRPNYRARLTDLGGAIGRLAVDAPEPAEVRVAARLDGDAPVVIAGRIAPLAPALALDLKASAKGIDLPGLTPYSTKYAGYPIERGKLSVDLGYRIDHGRLSADNHVFLDQLTFGERVDSPTATQLPVLLAVALLKNSRGEIDLDLPIAGSLDDPQFSVGGVIGRALLNLVTRAVTSPFRLLGAAFAGGSADAEALDRIDFAPGSALLADDQRARLAKLAAALKDRPALRLDVVGHADAARDGEPLRAARAEAQPRAAGAAPAAPVAAPAAAVAAPDPARRPPSGAAPADAAELRDLALARARVVLRTLVDTLGVARDRVFLNEPQLGGDAAGVEFGLR
ncbi:DUF748 domain-containing protein [Derxia lacustris]|uniref:DUF748 domain-containing protein n=1 Tax=Derxia lacustris TaxID=764842 RepID=UPI000A16E434|nr:DUF748 domain-containing protein [Derxia lacustris]